MEGQILGNRYELLEKVGGGGMALVYKAKCRLLNRFVAVKILRPEFTNDEEFVRRFRIEAQSAASLSHPNIVSIYDVGHENNVHYIVMEYVDGITLKEYITRNKKLDWREAIDITIQICSAIEQAHRNHIVHRDIKPHNILLTKEGIVKVTDFGIARAVTSSTITMVGSTIGSVHYFSPEQARGGFTDEKSDLYSLGIGLYEMVTGKVPFDGDTPVAVALKHIQEEAPTPLSIDADIPKGVNDIIMKAIKKDQNKRYQAASEMLQDLYKVLKEPQGGFVRFEEYDSSPTRKIEAIGADKLGNKDEYLLKDENTDTKKKKSDKLAVILAVITSLIIISIFFYVGISTGIPSIWSDNSPKEFVVRNYVGKDINDVEDELSKAGIGFKVTKQDSKDAQKDAVISQKPEAGKTLKVGGITPVELVVSNGPPMVKLDDYTKQDYRDVEQKITTLGLVPKIVDEHSDKVGEGIVIRTDPGADDSVAPGSTVTVYKSIGPELKQVAVPDLTGMTEMEAKKALADANLTIGKIFPEGSSSQGKIIKQEPAANTQVKETSPVNIYFEENTNPVALRKLVNIVINLDNPAAYGGKIKVYVEIVPSDTNKVEVLVPEQEKNKTDFPLTVVVPVPDKGKTDVRVYLDGKLYKGYPENVSGG